MSIPSIAKRLELIELDATEHDSDFARAVAEGLTAPAKTLPCRFFYDSRGSQLFERICETPEYYPTRTEHEILRNAAPAIAERFCGTTTLVELGSGSSMKTRTIIEAFLSKHGRLRYAPVDISPSILEESAKELLRDYPALEVTAIAAEYQQGLVKLDHTVEARKLILWLGSSIGNFRPDDAARFLRGVASTMHGNDRALIGIDLRKDAAILEAAYDDGAGVTADFNKNLLVRINRELGGTFELDKFEHRAVYDADLGRVEMHLVSCEQQTVAVAELEQSIDFDEGETIHTESSHKFSRAEIARLADDSGLEIADQWLDDDGLFSVNLFAPACSG